MLRIVALALLCLSAWSGNAEETRWTETLERISTAVVSIRVDSTRAFDTEWNQSSQATGFVVDADRGLILTNRHVVTPGPVVAQAIFLNQEEVDLVPIYRDPVHDFGFFRYDPAALKFIQPIELELDPEAARLDAIFALSAMMPGNSFRYWLARSPAWIGMLPTTVGVSTTTSIPFICRPHLELPGALPVLPLWTSTVRLWR